MDLQPLGDRLIVEALEDEETTVSGIVLPDTAKEKPQQGRVLAVGPGARNDKGEVIRAEALDLIGSHLEKLYDVLEEHDLAAGSMQARRLFS